MCIWFRMILQWQASKWLFQRSLVSAVPSILPPLPCPPTHTHLTLPAPLVSFPRHTACAILYIFEMESQSSLMFLFPLWLMILNTLEKKIFTGYLCCFFWELSVQLICWLFNSYRYLRNLIINLLFPHVQFLIFLHSATLETIWYSKPWNIFMILSVWGVIVFAIMFLFWNLLFLSVPWNVLSVFSFSSLEIWRSYIKVFEIFWVDFYAR